ncbi:MAG: DNA polymerase III subunit delta [Candidatus Doudnabacteria bacterium]
MTEKIQNNIYLFYGEDDFSLHRKIDRWKARFIEKYSASAISFLDGENLDETNLIKSLENILAPSLFAGKKLIIIRDGLPKKTEQEKLAEFLLDLPNHAGSDNFIIFWQSTKPDGRLKFTKQFKALVKVEESELPHGQVLNQWIKAMVKTQGSEITDEAADKLAVFLGRDLFEEKKTGGRVVMLKEAFDLWEVNSEIQKLTSLGGKIEAAQVEASVRPKIPDSVFALTDSMVAKNTKGTFQALENYLSTAGIEEKTSLIKIVGLLAEQLRSLLAVSLLQRENLDQAGIAERLDWSPGRVFVTAKNLKNISELKLKQLLSQLLSIDLKIKTSDSNVKLEIDMFLAQATR